MLFILQVDLEILIANVLDIWAKVDANRIIDKMKLHVLTHLPEDIRRFGPASLYIVEGFEGWNRIWRLCSILSNHHSPSRDIAIKLCKAERIKHLLSGGFWRDKDTKLYVQAGKGVCRLFEADKELRRRLGWNQTPSSTPGVSQSPSRANRFSCFDQITLGAGSINLVAAKKQPSACTWDGLFESGVIPPPHPNGVSAEEHLLIGKTVIAASGDVCSVGSWVFYRSQSVCYHFLLELPHFEMLTRGNVRPRNILQTVEKSQSTVLQWWGGSSRSLRPNPVVDMSSSKCLISQDPGIPGTECQRCTQTLIAHIR